MGKLIGRTKETAETINARRQLTVDMYTSGFSILDICKETGYVEDSVRQILRVKCPESYGTGQKDQEEDLENLQRAEDRRQIRRETALGKLYYDVTDLVVGR